MGPNSGGGSSGGLSSGGLGTQPLGTPNNQLTALRTTQPTPLQGWNPSNMGMQPGGPIPTTPGAPDWIQQRLGNYAGMPQASDPTQYGRWNFANNRAALNPLSGNNSGMGLGGGPGFALGGLGQGGTAGGQQPGGGISGGGQPGAGGWLSSGNGTMPGASTPGWLSGSQQGAAGQGGQAGSGYGTAQYGRMPDGVPFRSQADASAFQAQGSTPAAPGWPTGGGSQQQFSPDFARRVNQYSGGLGVNSAGGAGRLQGLEDESGLAANMLDQRTSSSGLGGYYDPAAQMQGYRMYSPQGLDMQNRGWADSGGNVTAAGLRGVNPLTGQVRTDAELDPATLARIQAMGGKG